MTNAPIGAGDRYYVYRPTLEKFDAAPSMRYSTEELYQLTAAI